MAQPGAVAGGLAADDARRLARALPPGATPDRRGLFAADSVLRRVSAEPALLASGGCALLLEVAHPLVAAGVAAHSDFRRDPLGRLRRTLDAMNAIVFGDLATALRAARGVEAAHDRVRGALGRAAGRHAAGTPYRGRDPELVLWVWATLLETAVRAHRRFVGPLEGDALERYVAENAVIARLLGADPGRVPESWRAFRDYFDDMLAGDALAVTDEAREIAAFVVAPPAGAPGGGALRAITTALLPERLRAEFGLPWDEASERRLDALAHAVQSLRRGPRS